MKISLAQINPTIGDLEYNLKLHLDNITKASSDNCDLIVFPELSVTGYPTKDLIEKNWFIDLCENTIAKLTELSKQSPSIGILVGTPTRNLKANGKKLFNSAILIQNGDVLFTQHKSLLPTYDVFDEGRHFEKAESIDVFTFKNQKLGITICEDAWANEINFYKTDPVEILNNKGAEIFINLSGSPFVLGKDIIRHKIFTDHSAKFKKPFLYVNQIGGNDDIVFDGRSFALNEKSNLIAYAKAFVEDLITVDLSSNHSHKEFKESNAIEDAYNALILGTKDYIRKTGFKKAVIGLSGGIDSALVAVIAKEALGSENVLGITMPSEYSSEGSISDSLVLAKKLNIECKTIPIKDAFEIYKKTLTPHFEGRKEDTTEENLQARIRGTILMAFSNKFGHILLSTGNKSEMAVGYCTLYGDMSGGLSVISDVPKTLVYKISNYINRNGEIIPQAIIEKAPSAELRPNQKDQDSLPAYDILDAILEMHIEDGLSANEIIAKGYETDTVRWVIRTAERAEYKRKQAAPGIKITSKAFGFGRRMPIAAKTF